MKIKPYDITRYIICLVLVSAVISFFVGTACVSAQEGINDAEARVLTAARGSFEFEGEKYVAKRYYVDQLIEYLSREDIDMTEEQADKAITKLYDNVETGINEGYIIKIVDDDDAKQAEIPEGKIKKRKDGSVTAYDHYGIVIMHVDGLLRKTGFSLQMPIIVLCILGCLFVIAVIYSIKKAFQIGGHYEP